MANFILRLPAVKMRTGLSRSSIYLWIAKGKFPAPVSLGARAVGWLESEVDDWLARLISESRKRRSEGYLQCPPKEA
jgi:prophage regulatory protein